MSPGPASATAAAIASRRPADLARAGRAGQDVAPDRGRILAARIVVGDDDQVGQPRRHRAHLGALADVAVAAGAEHDDQPVARMRPQRLDRRLDRIGRMGIIDIDRRAGAGDHRALEPAADRLDPGEIGEGRLELAAGGDDQAGRGQGIGGLIGADQRQIDLVGAAVGLDDQLLAERGGLARHQLQRLAAARRPSAPRGRRSRQRRTHLVGLGIVGPDHRRAVRLDHLAEQPHLGLEIGLHGAVIVEMVAAEIGEGGGLHRQAFGAILGKAVARRLERGMGDALRASPAMLDRKVTMSGVVRPVVTWSSAVVTPSVPMVAEGWPAIRHSWRVSSTFEVLPLVPVTAITTSGNGWKNLAASRANSRRGSSAANVRRAFDRGLRARDHRHRAGGDRGRDEVLAVEAGAAKGAEHRARRDLAMVDGEAGDGRIVVAADQHAEPHQCLVSPTSGSSSDVSMSRVSSGMTPSSGPVRETTLDTTGAAV